MSENDHEQADCVSKRIVREPLQYSCIVCREDTDVSRYIGSYVSVVCGAG